MSFETEAFPPPVRPADTSARIRNSVASKAKASSSRSISPRIKSRSSDKFPVCPLAVFAARARTSAMSANIFGARHDPRRSFSKRNLAMPQPCPSSPTRLSTEVSALSKNISLTSWSPAIPMIGRISTPG